jgi:hypothetical protein
MSVGKKKLLSLQSSLYRTDRRGVGNRPDVVVGAQSVSGRFRDRWVQKPGHCARFVMTPEPQAAWIGTAGGNGFGAGIDTLRQSLFVWENCCFFAIEQPHNAAANGFSKLLAVEKQRRFLQFGKTRGIENFRRLFAWNVDCIGRRIPSAEGQQNGHANEPARIAGMAD